MKLYLKSVVIVFSYLLFCLPNSAKAQNLNKDYHPLEIQSPIPNSILTKSYQKSQTQIEKRDNSNEKKRTRNAKEGYIIQTNYILDRLLESSQLLFNSELNTTIKQIAKKLLKDDTELYKKLTFYIIKSSSVNAFATDRGDVFVTMGLLARVKTEAELAFILAHEIIHTEEKHSMQSFDKQWEIKEESRFKNQGSVTFLTKTSNFSKEKEIEADSKGLELYNKTNYSFQNIRSVFEILEYSHAPVFRDSIDRSILELPKLKIIDELWTKAKPIETYEIAEIYGTHPDINLRVKNIQKLLIFDEEKDKMRKDFDVFTEAEFSRLMKYAQMELSFIYLTEKQYSQSLYHSSILLKEFPENLYLQSNFVYAIYAYAQHKQLSDLVEEPLLYEDKKMQGEPSKIRYLLDNMTNKEITVFATAHTFLLSQKYPDNEQLQRMAQDMAEDMVIYTIENPDSYFIKADSTNISYLPKERSKEEALEFVEESMPNELLIISDENVLKNVATTKEKRTSPDYFARTAFSNYLNDERFQKYLADGKEYRIKKEERDIAQKTKKGIKEKKREDRRTRVHGEKLGLDKVIFINPFYFKGKMNSKGEISQDYEKSEISQTELLTYFKEASKDIGLQTEVLDINDLQKNTEIEKMQDIRLIELYGDELYSNPGYIVSLYHNETQSIIEKYGTSHFAYLGIAALNNKARKRVVKRFKRVVVYPFSIFVAVEMVPHFIYRAFKSDNEIFYYSSVFDMRTYKSEMEEFNFLEMKDREEVVKTQLYWSLQQMKNKKK